MDPRLKLILTGDPEEVLLLLVRLKNPDVIVPFCKVITQFGDIITCRVKRKHLWDVYHSSDTFSVKAPRLIPATFQKEGKVPISSAGDQKPSRVSNAGYTGKDIYFAAVDWGFDIAHSNLCKRDGSTRFTCIWDQNGPYDGNLYGYGCIYEQDEINEALESNTPYEALGYHPGLNDVFGGGMHGTHVVDIAAGTPCIGEGGVAPETTLIGVQLGNNFVNGSDLALGDSVRLIEALHFIHASTQNAPCVINMSLGSHGDSHTGKSLVEIAFDNFLTKNPGYAIVQSVGNYYQSDCHIQYTLKQGETYDMEWNIPHRNPSLNEAEIWYPASDQFSLRLIAPDGEVITDVQPFKDIQIAYHGDPVGYVFHRSKEPNTGLNHIDIILDVSILKGKWIIAVIGTKVTNGFFHAYCERNDASQAKFSPHQSSPFTTTGSVCNSKHTITAGAYDHRNILKPVVRFSSSGPTLSGQPKPDLLAPGHKIFAARSAPAASTQPTNGLTRKSGSSMAAPHVAGSIALLFQKYLPERLSIFKIKELLFKSLDPLPAHFSTSDYIRAGKGFLNIDRLLEKKYHMDMINLTRPVRRPQAEAEEDFSGEQEYHAPYLHPGCRQCEDALLESIDEGVWENEPELLHVIDEAYSNEESAGSFDVYRHFHPLYQFEHSPYKKNFIPVALPGKRLSAGFRTGDIILTRIVLGGKNHQAVITDPVMLAKDELNGYATTPQKSGYYVQAYGNTAKGNKKMYIRVADNNNIIPRNVVVLRANKNITGEAEYQAIDETIPLPVRPTLKSGAQGSNVAYLQQRLNYHNTDQTEPLKEDGIWGPKTEKAVRSFQRAKGLDADGIVGPKTWAALDTGKDIVPGIDPFNVPPVYYTPPSFITPPKTPPGIIKSGFTPPVTAPINFRAFSHGFHFENDFDNHLLSRYIKKIPLLNIDLPLLDKIKTDGLCGGMAYAALDYYYSGLSIPPHKTSDFAYSNGIPPESSRLYDYLFQRQLHSFFGKSDTLTKYLVLSELPDDIVQRSSRETELPKIQHLINEGKPWVIGLITEGGITAVASCHQIVVYGYETDAVSQSTRLQIYDSNYPDHEGILNISNSLSPLIETINGRTIRWKGFFVMPYDHRHPSFMGDPNEVWSDDWSKNWTTFMPFVLNNEPHYLAYKTGTGQVSIDRVRANGHGVDTLWHADAGMAGSWTIGWSAIMPFILDNQPHYLAYKIKTGQVSIGYIPSNGQGVVEVWKAAAGMAGSWTTGWSTLMSFILNGHPHYLAYKISTGQVSIDRINPAGQGVTTVWSGTWTKGWSTFMPFTLNGRQQQHYLAYKIDTGEVSFDRIRPDGQDVDTVWTGKWGTGWSAFLPFTHNGEPHYLAYKTGTGQVSIDRIRPDGQGVVTVWSAGAGGWTKGWSNFLHLMLNGTGHYLGYKTDTGQMTISRYPL